MAVRQRPQRVLVQQRDGHGRDYRTREQTVYRWPPLLASRSVAPDSRHAFAAVRRAVEALTDDYYQSASEALAHYFMELYFELDQEEALEACDVGTRDRKGFGAYWEDDANRRLVL